MSDSCLPCKNRYLILSSVIFPYSLVYTIHFDVRIHLNPDTDFFLYPDLDPEPGFYSENWTNLQLKTGLQLKLILDVKVPGLQGKPPALQRALRNKKKYEFCPSFLGTVFGLPGSGFETMPSRYYGKCVLFM